MKKILFYTFLLISISISWLFVSFSSKEIAHSEKVNLTLKQSSKRAVVLELFTSQGCSSCPPADRLMGSFAMRKNVIPLSFHVDYWNHLGWKDPFCSKEYTRRQYNYASVLNASVYTPQLIINGQKEVIGSDSEKISTEINNLLESQQDASLTISQAEPINGKIHIRFSVSGKTDNTLLQIALIEKEVTTKITAGENGGVTLTNFNVVENFKTINAVKNGENEASIDFPNAVNLKNMGIVIFIQQKKNNRITAADQANLL